MGLKTTNYEVKKLGITLPTAYAIIRNMEIHGKKGKAEFIIQSTRETTSNKQPLERFYVDFTVNRNENPFVTAYNVAKGVSIKKVFDDDSGETSEVEKPNVLYGWEDDIL